MSKKVLVIISSLRANSNSDKLAEEFARGASESGNEVETISLKNKSINFCKGCLACQKGFKCVIKDDCTEIVEKIRTADVIVLATPIYFYSISSALKTVIDRTNAIYLLDYSFRDVYLLATAADEDSTAVSGAVKAVQGWVDCFENSEFKGYVFAGGVTECGEIAGNPKLIEAYNLGKTL